MANEIETLAGSWKLLSFFTEDVATQQRNNLYGEHPNGYIGITQEGRFFGLVTPDQQQPAHTIEEQAVAYRTMLAYSGRLTIDAEKFVVTVDWAWNREWVGTEQTRFWHVDGNTLRITSAPFPNANAAGGTVVGTLVWEREI